MCYDELDKFFGKYYIYIYIYFCLVKIMNDLIRFILFIYISMLIKFFMLEL